MELIPKIQKTFQVDFFRIEEVIILGASDENLGEVRRTP
jgi:hypothetical protein